MKFVCLIGMLALLMTGCATPPIETVSDSYVEQTPAEARQLIIDLPEEAAQPVMESGDGEKLYFCGDYELRVQTLRSGDLSGVLEEVTGYAIEQLTVIETVGGDWRRYDCGWSSTGAEGELVGRTAVLDDGSYCYCVTALSDSGEANALKQQWQHVFSSLELRQY